MTSPDDQDKRNNMERRLIYEMIDASCELAAKKGPHPLNADCLCMSCVTKRKKRLYPQIRKWTYHL